MFTEINNTPSMAVFSNPDGVLANMAATSVDRLRGDNVTIEEMRGNMFYEPGLDRFDRIAAAGKQLAENMDSYKKSSFYTTFARKMANKK